MMTREIPVHPVDKLYPEEKYRIYYCRVVDLAVFQGLLIPDPDSEIGHFAFSKYYYDGQTLDAKLQEDLHKFEREYPEFVSERNIYQNQKFFGIVEDFRLSNNTQKIQDLIVIGASHRVWPTGTSFTLTYPWGIDGRGSIVRFRDDLSEFMKRRILKILKANGKLRNPDLFGK